VKNNEIKVKEVVSKVMEMFVSGELPSVIARSYLRRKDGRPSDKWSLNNQLLMLVSGTLDARGYKQWQTVGRRVKKGAKAFYILGPMTRKVKKRDKEGNEAEVMIVRGFRTIPVFRYEDTEGAEIEVPDYDPIAPPPLFEVAEAWGLKVKYGPLIGDFLGQYRPLGQSVYLATHDIDVFFHELAHAARFRIDGASMSKVEEEVIAETVAASLCCIYGLNGYLAGSVDYIASFVKDAPVKMAMQLISKIEEVLNEILKQASALQMV